MMLAALTEPLLPEDWRDVVSLASLGFTVLGFVGTAAGLWYAIIQIRRTKSAADAAREAADRALEEGRRNFQRFTAANAHRLVNEVKIHVENGAWALAATRLNDLADQAAQLARGDPDWGQLIEELREWEATCRRRPEPAGKKLPVRRWADFTRRLQAKIDQWFGPYPSALQEASDDLG